MEKPCILVVDDDVHMRSSVVEFLRFSDTYEILEAEHGKAALNCLKKTRVQAIISDIKMPEMDGITLLKEIQHRYPHTPVLLMSAYGDIQTAVEAMHCGAFYFVEKGRPSFVDELETLLKRALDTSSLQRENTLLHRENRTLRKALRTDWNYVGTTAKIQKLRSLTETVSKSRSTVLITGESGTGKELIAKSIHALSDRAGGPFIKVNCAALPEGLIESELFGHEKGAFTGAIKSRNGKFELASGGTLLLDEIGEMPLSVQAKLLRVLQEKEVDKVGSDAPVDVNVRIIATTNRDLHKEVSEGTFREDLYYRINVFHFTLPPLRERKEDIEALAEHFITKYNEENGLSVTGLSSGAAAELLGHSWPGNIRELENAIERAVVLTGQGTIEPETLLLRKSPQEKSGLTPGMTVAQAERELIFKTLDFCNNNKTKTAELLDISIRTLRNKLKEYENEAAHE
ncbi:sigma-54-dependent transcriptional regulator [Chitinivibrio alkaliphilus]|uniref:Acetoacetate metabolism regulatory protein AtoC n=1 Tax=Chitinivibrio alkaliphilus ACht1 TaxID=1313304 RepID=U7DA39_9BACT|nr:sigma-54 dependent transcriptional regulator [Chitinivibrio alkaliphilus]ERP31977.1 acetoacetate metabolism regulatory protein AtoC [Chitinivibrio alkaliphilus ACht1]